MNLGENLIHSGCIGFLRFKHCKEAIRAKNFKIQDWRFRAINV